MAFLRHVALWCRDFEKSRRFYEQVIGWKFIGYRSNGRGLDMTDGTNNITLLDYGSRERPKFTEGHEYIHLGIFVDDMPAMWRRLHEWGAEFPGRTVKGRDPIDPNKIPSRAFKVFDPDGNILDITGDKNEWVGMSCGPTVSTEQPAGSRGKGHNG